LHGTNGSEAGGLWCRFNPTNEKAWGAISGPVAQTERCHRCLIAAAHRAGGQSQLRPDRAVQPADPLPDLIVCDVDATNLKLNLRLVLQARDLGPPMVLALA
jgi:hypothetical protein